MTDTPWQEVKDTDLRVRVVGDEFQLQVYSAVHGAHLRKTYDRSVALDLAKAIVDADEAAQLAEPGRVKGEEDVHA